MKYEIRKTARQYLILLAILLSSLLLITCLGDEEGECNTRDYSSIIRQPQSDAASNGRAQNRAE